MEATVQRKTLTMEDRKVLAEMWAAGERAAVIAEKLVPWDFAPGLSLP